MKTALCVLGLLGLLLVACGGETPPPASSESNGAANPGATPEGGSAGSVEEEEEEEVTEPGGEEESAPTAPAKETGAEEEQPAAEEQPADQEQPAVEEEPAAPEDTWAERALYDPSQADLKAPDVFLVEFDTTKGRFKVRCQRSWAPNGVDRFYNMVKMGYFTDIAFFRAVPNFVVQFGIHGTPGVNRMWMLNQEATIKDDPVKLGNRPGVLTFAKTGAPNSRSVQLFINLKDNGNLDAMGFAGIGQVVGNGMSVVNSLYTGYGERLTNAQGAIAQQGNEILRGTYPLLDYIASARFVQN